MSKLSNCTINYVVLCLLGCSVPDATPGSDPCELPNAATTATTDGACVVLDCVEGYDDCDKIGSNGCEVDTASETDNCGACGVACSFAHAAAACNQGVCSLVDCLSGFGDCDDDRATGCEAQLANSTENCGTCGNSCTYPNASAVCNSGVCALGTCINGWADCDSNQTTGCEVQLANSTENCGTCGSGCNYPNATAVCNGGVCALGTCESGWADCDNNQANGCEVQVANSTENCGACGNGCNYPNATAVCNGGVCALGTCESGWADCDNNQATGCEARLDSSSTNCGACSHDCLGGSCVASACTPVVLADGQGTPWAIAVDGTHVYWSVWTNPGRIRRVPRDGGLVQTLATSEALPDGLALTSSHVVWANTGGDTIRTVPLNGGAVETLATVSAGSKPAGVAVSDTHAFWTNWSTGNVQRVALTGGTPEDLSTGNSLPHRIATDGIYVWWTNIGDNAVRRVDTGGGGGISVADGQDAALGVAIDSANVYWTNQGDRAISRSSFANGAITVLAEAATTPAGIAVDDTYVYFTEGHPTGSVSRVLKTGGTPETLATNQGSPLYIAVDAVSVYWTNREAGQVMRLAK
jgi:hypothetical protein